MTNVTSLTTESSRKELIPEILYSDGKERALG